MHRNRPTATNRIHSIRNALLAAAGLATAAAIFVGAAASAGATTYYGPYLTTGSPYLNERSAPATSASIVGSLPYHSNVYLACQTTGTSVYGSSIWDQLSDSHYVSDFYVATGYTGWTPGIPQCGSTPPPTGGTWGRTVSYNEGATGECTWWAINEFHTFTGVYPNLVAPGNNGNAEYWAGNAAYNGWTVSATPRVDTIVVFPPYTNGSGSVGHVAWVTSVSGGQITVSEMNFKAWDQVDTRTLSPTSSVRYILAP
jgi:surface antigen